jgi:hypothetical protein
VSLADFQRAFARIVADPRSWPARLASGDGTIDGLELTTRERDRLRRLLAHPGMRANQVLLRSTRAMPLHSALPLTCDWLRHEVPDAMDAWLAASGDASVQYGREADRFGDWLPGFRAARGHGVHPALDALRIERALRRLVSEVEGGETEPAVPIELAHALDDVLAGWRRDVRVPRAVTRGWLRVRDGNVVLEPDGGAADHLHSG